MDSRQAKGKCQWPSRLGKRTLLRLSEFKPAHAGRSHLLADAEFRNHGLVAFRVVFLQIVEQASAPAHHHQKPTA